MKIFSTNDWQIPDNWKIVSIGEITSDWRGGASLAPEDFKDEGFPILHKGAIQKNGKILIDEKKKTFATRDYALSNPNSIVNKSYLAVTLRDLVPSGPSIGLIADLSKSSSSEFLLAQGAYGFKIDKDRVNPSYLVHLSNYQPFRGYMKRYAVGSTQIHIRTPIFQTLQIPLPPLAEQKRIAEVLDKTDALREKRRRALQKLDTLLQSVFLEMFGDPVKNPMGWDIYELGDVCKFISGNSLPEGEDFNNQKDGLLLVKVSDMNLIGNEKFLSYSNLWQESYPNKNSICPKNSIIIPKRGGAIFTNKKRMLTRPAVLDPNLMAIIPDEEKLNPSFIFRWFQQFDLGSITSGSSVPQLNKKDLSPLTIAVPPLEKQNDFFDKNQAFKKIRHKMENSLNHFENLFQSLQQKAFKGELFDDKVN